MKRLHFLVLAISTAFLAQQPAATPLYKGSGAVICGLKAANLRGSITCSLYNPWGEKITSKEVKAISGKEIYSFVLKGSNPQEQYTVGCQFLTETEEGQIQEVKRTKQVVTDRHGDTVLLFELPARTQ